MLTEPRVEHRDKQYYAAIRTKVNMNDIALVLPPYIPVVYNWLMKNNIAPAGHLFFRYLSMDKNHVLVAEVGVPVDKPVTGNENILPGFFPEGTYALITHLGHYRHLREAHMTMESVIKKNGWKEKLQTTDNGALWGTRTEFYINDPQKETNPDKWQTDIALLLEEE